MVKQFSIPCSKISSSTPVNELERDDMDGQVILNSVLIDAYVIGSSIFSNRDAASEHDKRVEERVNEESKGEYGNLFLSNIISEEVERNPSLPLLERSNYDSKKSVDGKRKNTTVTYTTNSNSNNHRNTNNNRKINYNNKNNNCSNNNNNY